jgi:hypothetical protein
MLRGPRRIALATIAAVVAAASLTSFAESYRGLYLWAAHHGLTGAWSAIWPLQVDTFIAVGELALFVALVDHWAGRSRLAAWSVTLAGLGVSVAGNIGHVAGHSLTNRATAAVPPLAAAAALAVGLGVLKRVAEQHHADQLAAAAASTADTPASRAAPELAAGTAPAGTGRTRKPAPVLDPVILADAETDSARIRYAVRVTRARRPAEIVAVLTAAGYPVSSENARSVMRRSQRPPAESPLPAAPAPDATALAGQLAPFPAAELALLNGHVGVR